MKYGFIILLTIMLFKSNNEIIVDELGFRLSVPKNYKNDRLRGGTYLWIKVNGSTKAGIQRWPNTFSYDDFRLQIQNFNPWHEGKISEGINSEEVHKVIIDQKENFFKYIKTNFYNFYIWSESADILQTLIEGLILDEEILRNQFHKGIDYPIAGTETIEFANRQYVFFRDSINIFQVNIDTSYYINPYLMVSDGNMENRYQNIYSLTEIPNHIKSIKISINASDRTGTDQLNYRKEFEVK